MTPEEVQEFLTELLVDEFGVEAEEIAPEATLEDLDVDSLDLVEIAQVFEERTGVRVTGEDAKDLKTVGEVVALLARLSTAGPDAQPVEG